MVSPGAVYVPSGIGEVTPQWLTAVLRGDANGISSATVTGLHAEQIALDTGFSALLYRLHLTGDGVPPTVIVKLPAESMARAAMEMLGGYRRELAFYQRIAPHAPITTARVYAAQTVGDSADFVLVMEDLGSWENADHLAGLSMERTRVCIEQLAGLHAWSVHSAPPDALEVFPSLDTPIAREIFVPAFAPAWEVYREKTTATIPSPVARYAQRFADHAPVALAALTERSMLLHGDIRADNMFFDGDQLKVVDLQMAALGAGAADIGYLVSQGLPTAVRRGHDEELVRTYSEQLREHGVTDYAFDEAWRYYRFAIAYLMLLPVVILNTWDTMGERSRALCLTLTDRAVAAIEDTDALVVFS